MRICFLIATCTIVFTAVSTAQEVAPIEIYGDRLADAEKLNSIWLYPEDYEGKTIRLYRFCFEPENFEYFPELNGYLFSCEPVAYGRDSVHPHVGKSELLSREKLNLFCSTAEGKRIRSMFKERQGEVALPAEVVITIEKRNDVYFGNLVSYKPRSLEQQPPVPGR
jgi:hypothetical protein